MKIAYENRKQELEGLSRIRLTEVAMPYIPFSDKKAPYLGFNEKEKEKRLPMLPGITAEKLINMTLENEFPEDHELFSRM